MTRIGLRLSRAHHARIGAFELQENVAGFSNSIFATISGRLLREAIDGVFASAAVSPYGEQHRALCRAPGRS
jgi:hypothetical protein